MSEPGGDGSRTEIRLSGSGGQGVILAAAIIADAAAAIGRHVVQTQSYGPEARGGASKAEVVIGSEEVDFPEVTAADVTLCLSQAAFDKYAGESKPGSLVLYDAELVTPGELAGRRLAGIDFTRAAGSRLGKTMVANIVAVGAMVELIGWLPYDAVLAAVERRVPERFRELNVKALQLGRELAQPVAAA
jgi:2-oxoglutarate ferredoxin oxidoreductase subunit gamma